jgi:hypothetical protein
VNDFDPPFSFYIVALLIISPVIGFLAYGVFQLLKLGWAFGYFSEQYLLDFFSDVFKRLYFG